MQFNNKITVVENTLDEFSQEVAGESFTIKCAVLSQKKGVQNLKGGKYSKYSLQIITPYKNLEPYNTIMANDDMTFEYDGNEYNKPLIETINSPSGKVKYYQVSLMEKK